MLPSILYIMSPTHLQRLKLLRPTVLEMHIHDLGVTQNVSLYHPHNMTYAPLKFIVVKCNGLGGDTFT